MTRSHVIAGVRTPRRRDEDELQQQLNDVLSLAVAGDHVRWVVTGDGSAELAAWLTVAVAEWRGCADRVAQELSASGVAPDGRIRSLARDIPVNWVPDGWLSAADARRLVLDRIGTVAKWTRYRCSCADGHRADLLDRICFLLEAQLSEQGAS
jgi:starvation-inducible DNA-binding protein